MNFPNILSDILSNILTNEDFTAPVGDQEDHLFIAAHNKSIDRWFPHVTRSLSDTIEPSRNSIGISSQLNILLVIGKVNENHRYRCDGL